MDNENSQIANVEKVVSFKEWVITLLILCIPLVNIVMVFVWAFGEGAKKSKSNYFKATLLFAAIAIVLGIISAIIFMDAGISMMNKFSNY